MTYLTPSLDIRLRGKGASVGVAINGQVWAVIPQSLRLSTFVIPVQIYRSTLKVTYLPPSLDVRLRRKGASAGVPINGQVWVVIPQSLRLSGGLHQSHIEFWKRGKIE